MRFARLLFNHAALHRPADSSAVGILLIATGTAEAAQAVAQAAVYINPGRKLGALVHSSSDPRFAAKHTTQAPPHRH
jgi:hypothetical protein